MPAQLLGDGEHEVGRGDALGELAVKLEADDPRHEHGDGLAEHRGLGFDAANAPADDSQPVHHRGVGVGADQRVGIDRSVIGVEDHAGQVLQVDLMTDPRVGRDHAQPVEGLLAPPEELVPLAVAVELPLRVERERVSGAETINDHRVVDHQLGRHMGLDACRITAQRLDAVPHRCQVDDGGDAGEVLHQDPRGENATSRFGAEEGSQVASCFDVGGGDRPAVLVTKQVLQQHLQRVRKSRDVESTERRERKVFVGALTHYELSAAAERI